MNGQGAACCSPEQNFTEWTPHPGGAAAGDEGLL